ncbi:Uncharacterised protein [Acidipropionibacterium jensenii]|uniref:Uncharacterized protein n=1 Tax=Acidipropionibacterium jensenii TaxID=1749 RepID=A0A3S4V2U0_9ACTN|nr:hypothetical protein [Acidipropionibacterium jensenii]VEI03487.1 Uncharacterised protein [Acidipropionibacterium jensenii]
MPGSLNWWRTTVTAWCEHNKVSRSTSQIRKIARRLHAIGVMADIDMQIGREIDRQIARIDDLVGLNNMVSNRRGSRIADGEIDKELKESAAQFIADTQEGPSAS